MNDYRNHVYRLMLAASRCTSVYKKIAKEQGVKENTLLFMDILSDGKQHSQKQICEDWMIPRTTLNTIVTECMQDGYIILLSQNQSKEKLIALTDKGKCFAETITRAMNTAVQNAMRKITEESGTDFIRVFEQYVEYLQEEYKNI